MDAYETTLRATFDKLLKDNPRFAEHGIGEMYNFNKERKVLEDSFDAFQVSIKYLLKMKNEDIFGRPAIYYADILTKSTGLYIPPGVLSLAAKFLGHRIPKLQGSIPTTLIDFPKNRKP